MSTDLHAVLQRADALLVRSQTLLAEAKRPFSSSPTHERAGAREHPELHAVAIQPRTANPKLAPQRAEIAKSGRRRFVPTGPYCTSTYVSIAATCPETCVFRDNGCYAQAGSMHLTMGGLDAAGRRTTAQAVTAAEADALRELWAGPVPQDGAMGGRDLRLHVGGDVSDTDGARRLASAVEYLRGRGLGDTWTYTHRWREIPRDAWGPIAVLASCETRADVIDAMCRGYAAAVTVPTFASRAAFEVAPAVKAIPCPYEARENGPTCVRCRLCFDPDGLRARGRAIAFVAHGAQAPRARHRLAVLRGDA